MRLGDSSHASARSTQCASPYLCRVRRLDTPRRDDVGDTLVSLHSAAVRDVRPAPAVEREQVGHLLAKLRLGHGGRPSPPALSCGAHAPSPPPHFSPSCALSSPRPAATLHHSSPSWSRALPPP